jgi:hypothetical protein
MLTLPGDVHPSATVRTVTTPAQPSHRMSSSVAAPKPTPLGRLDVPRRFVVQRSPMPVAVARNPVAAAAEPRETPRHRIVRPQPVESTPRLAWPRRRDPEAFIAAADIGSPFARSPMAVPQSASGRPSNLVLQRSPLPAPRVEPISQSASSGADTPPVTREVPDIEDLVNRVFARMVRQMSIEAERRGSWPWPWRS